MMMMKCQPFPPCTSVDIPLQTTVNFWPKIRDTKEQIYIKTPESVYTGTQMTIFVLFCDVTAS